MCVCVCTMRQTVRRTDGRTGGHTGGQVDRRTDRTIYIFSNRVPNQPTSQGFVKKRQGFLIRSSTQVAKDSFVVYVARGSRSYLCYTYIQYVSLDSPCFVPLSWNIKATEVRCFRLYNLTPAVCLILGRLTWGKSKEAHCIIRYKTTLDVCSHLHSVSCLATTTGQNETSIK